MKCPTPTLLDERRRDSRRLSPQQGLPSPHKKRVSYQQFAWTALGDEFRLHLCSYPNDNFLDFM
jgi:hypothetical protein